MCKSVCVCACVCVRPSERRDMAIKCFRGYWCSDTPTFMELKSYFESIEDFPEISITEGELTYCFLSQNQCIKFGNKTNDLFPGCGAFIIGEENGPQHPLTRESFNFWHLIQYVCDGRLQFDSTKGEWYSTKPDERGRYDCRAFYDECNIERPVESLNDWLVRMMSILQNGHAHSGIAPTLLCPTCAQNVPFAQGDD